MYIRCAQCFVVMEDGRVGALNDLIFFVIESRREKFIFDLCTSLNVNYSNQLTYGQL